MRAGFSPLEWVTHDNPKVIKGLTFSLDII